MGYRIGDQVEYGKTVLRLSKCWRCVHHGEYEWRKSGYPSGMGERVAHSKKMFCQITKRWGDPERAFFCRHYEERSEDE